jgi:hypothetical protein
MNWSLQERTQEFVQALGLPGCWVERVRELQLQAPAQAQLDFAGPVEREVLAEFVVRAAGPMPSR